jgi:FkbM family methyltransferase
MKARKRVFGYLLLLGSRLPACAIVGFLRVLRLFGANTNLHLFFYHTLSNRLDLRVWNDGIVFDGSTKSGASRAIRLLTKEPDTISWIENYFSLGDVFYDVGANIGVYSLYAAKKLDVDVIAFEPESLSYAALNTNIFHNKLATKIKALNLALYNADTISKLNISNFQTGKSSHNFHENLIIPTHISFQRLSKLLLE